MDSVKNLKYHVFVFQIFGLWPPINGSMLYSVYSYICVWVILIFFPATLLLSMLFVDSLEKVVDNLIINSSLSMASLKGINVLRRKRHLLRLFQMIRKMDSDCSKEEEISFRPLFMEIKILYWLATITYFLAYIFLGSQSIWSERGKGLWSSTYFFPFDFAKNEILYQAVFIHQAISNLVIVILDAAVDTYGVICSHIIGGHVDALGARLRALGTDSISKDLAHRVAVDKLRTLVDRYELSLRYIFKNL